MAASAVKPLTINVGKFGTNPVSRYVIKTGTKKIKAINANTADNPPKQANGL